MRNVGGGRLAAASARMTGSSSPVGHAGTHSPNDVTGSPRRGESPAEKGGRGARKRDRGTSASNRNRLREAIERGHVVRTTRSADHDQATPPVAGSPPTTEAASGPETDTTNG